MATDKMPLMLDNNMAVDLNEVDDLFGDGAPLSLANRNAGKQLHRRMDQLRNRGCRQTVAWSKSGTIASISGDGETLELRFLRCHPDDGMWHLSEPTTCDLVRGTAAVPLVHLEWATTSVSELAVIDAAGRVHLMSFSISLNHPFATRSWENDNVDDGSIVVGCHWLATGPANQQKPYNVLYGPATKHSNSYSYESSFMPSSGPHHPHPAKSALFCVTMNGTLKMFFSQNNTRVEDTSMELECIGSTDELVTHAALASDKRHLLIAMVTTSRKLRLTTIEIQWGGPGAVSEKQLPQNARLNPSLVENHLATIDLLPGEDSMSGSTADLTNIHLLSSLLDNTGKNTASAMVLALRPSTGGDSFQAAQTVIDRWEVIEERQGLHNAFEQLGTRRNSVSSELPSATRLQKLEPIIVNKVVVGFQTTNFGKILLLTMADGSVEYRDRFTFEPLYTTEDIDKVMNLQQAGWVFPEDTPCIEVAYSPTCCSMVQVGEDKKLRWTKLRYPKGDVGESFQDANYGATIAGVVIATASAVWYQSNFDDLIALMRPLADKKRFMQDWIGDMIRILKIQVDYSEETHHDSLMRNTNLQACFSIMNSLGFQGEYSPRTFASKIANVNLNLRGVVIMITISSNTPVQVRERMSPLDEHEVVYALAGCAKWSLDLLSWLIERLFELMHDEKFIELLVPKRHAEMTAYLHEKNDIALHLLLSSCSRSFLSAVCRRIAHLEGISTRAIDFYRRQSAQADQASSGKMPSPQLQQAYQQMQRVAAASLIKVTEFEKLLNVLNHDIRQAYQAFLPNLIKQNANAPQGKQADMAVKTMQVQLELFMLLSKSPPPAFLPVIRKLFTDGLKTFRAQTDPGRLFFHDFSLLSMEDDAQSLKLKKDRRVWVDLFNKSELRPNEEQQWRRCVRCASVMEEKAGDKPGFVFVLGQQRKCSCGGQWALLPPNKLLV